MLITALAVTACDSRQSGDTVTPDEKPVVVFADIDDKAYLPALFADYTRATGVDVTVRHAASDVLIDDIVGNRVSPAADLLWLSDVASLWRAAEEGALRPLASALIETNVPPVLRDPDGFWMGIGFRLGFIVFNAERVEARSIQDYASLASERFKDQLCLSSSGQPVNQRVLSTLIDALEIRRTERVVRGWIANLAQPVFATEKQLLAAIQIGDCAIGIASSAEFSRAASANSSFDLRRQIPDRVAIDAEGAGIARHAHNPDGAIRLLEWLSTRPVQSRHAVSRGAYAVQSDAERPAGLDAADYDIAAAPNVAALAMLEEEAALLAERTLYRE
jgi:iron(III) transport system substrate-binding protein